MARSGRSRKLQSESAEPSNVLGAYSTSQVAKLAAITPAVVRRYAISGLVGNGETPPRFNFQDLVLLRGVRDLRKARISSQRIRAALLRLRDQLPADVPVSGVSIEAEGGRIVARHRDEVWDLESGQRVLNLVATAPSTASETAVATSVADQIDSWFGRGVEHEAVDAAEAAHCYRRVLALDRDHPDAHLNLGRLLHERGDLTVAERHYRRAIAIRDDDPTAWFNLGVVLQDRGRRRRAVEAYERTTALDADYADAHFNLGNLYRELGDAGSAMQAFKRYRELSEE